MNLRKDFIFFFLTKELSALCLNATEADAPQHLNSGAPKTEISIAQCAQRIPLLIQNLREIDSISFAYTEEISDNRGITWRRDKQIHFIADIKNKMYKKTEVIYPTSPQQNLKYMEIVNVDGKFINFHGEIDRKEKIVFQPQKLNNLQGAIQHGVGNITLETPFLFFYFFNNGNTRINEIFTNPKAFSAIKIRESNLGKNVSIHAGGVRFDFDSATGLLSKRVDEAYLTAKVARDHFIMQADEYIEQNGWFFPKTLIRKYGDSIPDKRAYRTTIQSESFEINKKYVLSDFSVVIPAGTYVYDEIKNAYQKIERPMSSMDIKSISKQLEDIIERSRKEEKK
jgi:hypothetical protein